MTASTFPLLVLIAFLWWKTKGDVLSIVLFTSIFDAAAALILGGSPVSPWLFALAICLPIKLLSGKLHWKPVDGLNKQAFLMVALFVGYGAFSSFVWPFLFHGILVTNDRNGSNQPLSWSLSNLAQLLYLLATFVIYLLAVHSTREQLRNAIAWYVRGCVCIAFFSMYELAHMVLHVPYPSAVLYSNTTHVIFDAYKVSGVWRLNSTLSEASGVAYYLSAGIALLGWHIARHRVQLKTGAAFLLMLTALVLTVSTTAYACMGAMILAAVFFAATSGLRSGRIAPIKLLLFLVLAAVAIPLFTLTNASQTVAHVFQGVFIDKVDTESYRTRSMMNTLALQSAHDTYYFGAGWGSVRASSFVCSVLGNAGVPGLLLFVLFLVQSARPLLRPKIYQNFELFEQSFFAIFALVVALMVAAPDICQPILWTLFGIVTVAKPRRLRMPAQQRRHERLVMPRTAFLPSGAD